LASFCGSGLFFPLCRLSRPRSTTAAPPRPARSAVGAPIPEPGLDARTLGEPAPGGSRVHRDSLVGVGARLCPSGLATATPQPFTVASPGQRNTARPEVPAASTHVGTHRARPVSARFEPVNALKGVMTPVPRVLLSVSLAGPAPSGSPGRAPAFPGPLPPSPAPPGSGCPQLQRPAATGRRRRPLTSTRTTAPHGARRKASGAPGSDGTNLGRSLHLPGASPYPPANPAPVITPLPPRDDNDIVT
jgi:hypothetical protein